MDVLAFNWTYKVIGIKRNFLLVGDSRSGRFTVTFTTSPAWNDSNAWKRSASVFIFISSIFTIISPISINPEQRVANNETTTSFDHGKSQDYGMP